MVYRPLRSLCQCALAASLVSLGVANLYAQTNAAPAAPAPAGSNASRFDLFTGFSYFGAHGQVKPAGISYSSINEGAIGSGAYYFNKNFGAEFIYSNHPDGNNDGFSGASLGPIFRAPMEDFTLFAHGLVGGGRLGGPNSEGPIVYHEPYRWGPALTAGGGMDFDLPFFNHRFGLRLFELDYRYVHDDYGPYTAPPVTGVMGGRANLNGVELSTGIITHFGSITPPPPVTYACSVAPATAYPGDPVTVTGTPANLNPKKTPTYNWTSDGGTITGNNTTANIDTKTAQPGTYTVKGHVEEGKKPGQAADCTAQFTVKQFEPPTISCSANPTTVEPGGSSTISCNGVSPQNRPLTYSYSATAGSISGTTNSATLSTTGASPGPITVTGNVVDDKGQSASATTTVTVNAPPPPPPPPAPQASNLCTVNFSRDKARPTRVDNEGKACLDDVALSLQRSSDAKLALVGNDDAKEQKRHYTKGRTPAAIRAVNTKDYLVTEKGIDASRITLYTGTDDARNVTTTLIPAGATNPVQSDTTVDESTVKPTPVRRPRKK